MQLTTIHRFTEGGALLLEAQATLEVPAGAPAPGVVAAGAYTAWPDSCAIPGGRLCVYTRGNSHHGDNSGAVYAREKGASWQPETLVYDSPLWSSAMGVAWIDGRAFVSLWSNNVGVANTGRAGLVTSTDRKTWGAWIDLHGPAGFTRESFTAGPVVKWGGFYWVTVEGTNSGDPPDLNACRLLKSADGLAWGGALQIAAAPAYESRLVATPGELLCLHRTADGPSTTTVNWSSDGTTWSAPVPAFEGHAAPKCIRTDAGRLCAVTRRNTDRAAIAYFSDDGGRHWGPAVLIDADLYEMEYGCPVQIPGALVVDYGVQPTASLTLSSVKESVIAEPPPIVAPPPPPPAGTWSTTDRAPAVAVNGATASTSGALGSVRSVTGHASGRWQAEIVLGGDTNQLFGVARAAAPLGSYPGSEANGFAFYPYDGKKFNGQATAYGPSGLATFGIEVDEGVVRFHRNGVSLGNAFQATGELFLMWGPGTSGPGLRSATLNTAGPFQFPIAGASPWG